MRRIKQSRSYFHLLDGIVVRGILTFVKTTAAADTIRFTTKGQVVIPLRLRKQFHIEEGTRAIVTVTDDGILIKPVTRHAIRRLRGILKRKPGEKPFAGEWQEHQREEKQLEETDYARSTGAR